MSDSSGPLTQDQALALLQRTSDVGWIQGELQGPDGTAVINARTAVMAAASRSVMAQAAASTISDAPGGGPGTCLLTVNRTIWDTEIAIPAGYRFITAEGINLVLQSPVVIPVGTAQATLPLQTLRSTELVNTYDPAFDSLLNEGDLLESSTLGLQAGASAVSPNSPPVYDSGDHQVLGPGTPATGYALTYGGSTLIQGASSDWLSAHGDERGVRRRSGESTEEYRARIRQIPDAVSPDAIASDVHGAASNVGIGTVTMVETANPGCSDAAMAAIDLAFQDTACDTDFCDDPIGVPLAAKGPNPSLETVSLREGRAYFRLDVAGPLAEPDGSTLYFDDGYCDDPAWGFPDTVNQQVISALLKIQNAADAKKAAGVNALAGAPGTQTDVFIADNQLIIGMDPTIVSAGEEADVWTVFSDSLASPGSETKAWLLRDGLLSTSSQTLLAPNPPTPGKVQHHVTFTFSDSTTFTTPWWSSSDSEHLTLARLQAIGYPFKPVVRIDAAIYNTGASSANCVLFGSFWGPVYTL